MSTRDISPADPISHAAIRGLMDTWPILNDIEFYTRTGPADSVKRAPSGTNASKITRSLNEANTPTAGSRSYDTVTKKIVSFDAKVDVMLEDRNEDPEAELMVQTYLEAVEAGWVGQDMSFSGDVGGDAEDFDGMANLVQADQIITFETNGIYIPVGNSDANMGYQQKAIEYLLKAFASIRGGATHAYMNEYVKVRWLTVAKALGYYRQSKDELGNLIEYIGNTIIRGAGYKKDGTLILPLSETCGTSNNTSSMFACRWGERKDLTALTSVGVKGRYAGQSGNQIINNVNLDMVLHLQDYTALYQFKGWQLELAS